MISLSVSLRWQPAYIEKSGVGWTVFWIVLSSQADRKVPPSRIEGKIHDIMCMAFVYLFIKFNKNRLKACTYLNVLTNLKLWFTYRQCDGRGGMYRRTSRVSFKGSYFHEWRPVLEIIRASDEPNLACDKLTLPVLSEINLQIPFIFPLQASAEELMGPPMFKITDNVLSICYNECEGPAWVWP